MTLTEARGHIGDPVLYRRSRSPMAAEEGVITSVGVSYVWVRYSDGGTPRATRPEDLTLAGEVS